MAHECTSTSEKKKMLSRAFMYGMAEGAKTALVVAVCLLVFSNVGSYLFTKWLNTQQIEASAVFEEKTKTIGKLLIPIPYMDVEHTEAYQNQLKAGVDPLKVIAEINKANSKTVPEMLTDGSFVVFMQYADQANSLKAATSRTHALEELKGSMRNSKILYPGYWLAN